MDQDFKTIVTNWCEKNLSDGKAEMVAVSREELDRLHEVATKGCDILDSVVAGYSSLVIMLGNLRLEAERWGMDREAALYALILESPEMEELRKDVIRADDFLIGDYEDISREPGLECP